MKRMDPPRRRIGVALLVGLLSVAVLPLGGVSADPGAGPDRLERTLDALVGALDRLESELDRLDRAEPERLEEKVETAIDAVESLLEIIESPRKGLDEREWKARLLMIDLHLHRLLYVLEEIVESSVTIERRPDTEDAVENVKEKLESWIAFSSVGMSPDEYEQLERAVFRTARALGERVADLARRVGPKSTTPGLARLVERLEELLFHLDGYILRSFAQD